MIFGQRAPHPPPRSQPAHGTNPIAFAAPVTGENPLLVGLATTVVPLNQVKVYGLKGEDLPADWVADEHGQVLTDAAQIYHKLEMAKDAGMSLLPLGGTAFNTGGHKGSALASMVQVLSAAISGADQPGNFDDYQSIGYFFFALDPQLVNPTGDASEYVRIFRNTIRGLAPVDPALPVQATCDCDFLTRQDRETNGIPMADALVDQLCTLSAELTVPFTLVESSVS